MPSTTSSTPSGTKTALLDAAEHLFAERGVGAASLRAITSAANANLASVNYHFGSKEGLVRAVFTRRLRPLNARRLELLDRCLGQGVGSPDLSAVLEAFVGPVVTMMNSSEPGARDFVQLMGRTLAEPSDALRAMVVGEFQEVLERFSAALGAAVPGLSASETAWRLHFTVGAMAHTLAARRLMARYLQGLSLEALDDPQVVTRRLVSFLESGWRGDVRRPGRKGPRPK